MTCGLCGKPATRTVALSLALSHNVPICDDEFCEHRASAVLLRRADQSKGGPADG